MSDELEHIPPHEARPRGQELTGDQENRRRHKTSRDPHQVQGKAYRMAVPRPPVPIDSRQQRHDHGSLTPSAWNSNKLLRQNQEAFLKVREKSISRRQSRRNVRECAIGPAGDYNGRRDGLGSIAILRSLQGQAAAVRAGRGPTRHPRRPRR